MRFICLKQDNIKDCGITSLLMIIRYYNGNISKEVLRKMTRTTNNGVNAFYLMKAAQEIGFSTRALKGDITCLSKSDFPLIAHVIVHKSFQHFVVVYGIKNNKLIIADPSRGLSKMALSEWNKISTNKYLLFKPLKKIPKLSYDLKMIDILWTFIKNYQTIFIIIFLFSLIYTIFNIITSYNFKILMNITGNNYSFNIKILVIILLIFGLIKNLTDLFRIRLLNFITIKLDKILVQEVYSHIIYLPYLYYKNRTSGDIISRINDIFSVKELLAKVFLTLFVDIILIIFVFIILWRINSSLTIIALFMLITYTLIIFLYNKLINPYVDRSYEQGALVNSYLVETINAIDTIKGENIENMVCNNLNIKYEKYCKLNERIAKLFQSQEFFKELIHYIGLVLISYMGFKYIKNEKITIIDLMTYMGLLSYYLEPIKNILDLQFIFKKAVTSFKRIIELYTIKDEKFLITSKKINGFLNGDIRFHQVSYSYNGVDNILNNINLEIKAKSHVLICGNSGQGKSTLVKLLVKYLDNYEGKITIDNRELKYYDLIDIRSRIRYVSQNEMLFNDTLYNNIVLRKEVLFDDFLKVVKLTYIEDFLNNLPLKYDTFLEENGFNLSGGERQRIVLARTLLKDADIYIFDEAMNAIDIKRERMILKNIFTYLQNKTVIVISHRFNNEDLFDVKVDIGDLNDYGFY